MDGNEVESVIKRGFPGTGWSVWNISTHDPCGEQRQRGHSLLWLWVQQWCLENDGPVLTASASPQECTKAELSIQSTAMGEQPVCRTPWEKLHETREEPANVKVGTNTFWGPATSNQEADSTFKYPKWHEMKMMCGRLCLCSLMGHQDLCYDGAD